MGTTQFILALHNHQPVGNFENVFREAFEKCYDPFLEFLEGHPHLRVCLHYSGCLFDWFEAREKQFLKRLARLVRLNQVEILGGGYYEPILPLIPEPDAVQQLNFMNGYLRKNFGRTPKGFWLTERVWEQKIPRLAAKAGLEYTALDDTHFNLAGLPESQIKNFFITEEEGAPLHLFPIPKFLRYSIPFREPHETIEYLKKVAQENHTPAVVTYADDGEKFGLWPGTYPWVYRAGWLRRFAEALEENCSWLSLKTFSEVLHENKGNPTQKVYLPTASYEEMTEWALSLGKGREFLPLKKELEGTGAWDRFRGFFQGGTFKNFLVKYSEADWMRSKMRWVSRKVAGEKLPRKKKLAETELWQGQCNCPYWHGVFGGLYLHHLRRTTYEHLIRAERIMASGEIREIQISEGDVNQDGARELIIETPIFSFYFLPKRGGTLAELDYLPEAMNVLDVMTRREESYHGDPAQRKGEGGVQGKSIHNLNKSISREVGERMAFDAWERHSLSERFLPPKTSLDELWKGRAHALHEDPTRVPYQSHWTQKKDEVELVLKGKTHLLSLETSLDLTKKVTIPKGQSFFTVGFKIQNKGSKEIDCLWGSEWSFNFFDLEREEKGVRRVQIQDGWSPVFIEIKGAGPFDYWQYPIETVAQTESDFRLLHQGIAVFPHWRLSLKPGEVSQQVLTFSFSNHHGKIDS